MAKIKNGILGPLSGKLGPVIGGTWKNIAYIRAVPQITKKRSAGQIATQEKMRFLNNFLVPFHNYINTGFKNEAENRTEISAAFRENYHTAISGVHPDLRVEYGKFLFSKGTLPMVTNMKAAITNGSIELTWDNPQMPGAAYNDQLMLLLYVRELKRTDGFTGGVNRTAKRCTFKFNPSFAGKMIDVYVSFISWDRKQIANSVYLGRLDSAI